MRIRLDDGTLESIMADLDVMRNRYKETLAVGESVSRSLNLKHILDGYLGKEGEAIIKPQMEDSSYEVQQLNVMAHNYVFGEVNLWQAGIDPKDTEDVLADRKTVRLWLRNNFVEADRKMLPEHLAESLSQILSSFRVKIEDEYEGYQDESEDYGTTPAKYEALLHEFILTNFTPKEEVTESGDEL